mmetsp:Transcript_11038/g.24095  ORF Transcript_11038/g.24095 Transcript_11038/m.24095 type:complete len:310 (-) Transcript_11038:46-975(-)
MPERFTPPHGNCAKHGCEQFSHTMPAASASPTRLARSSSAESTAAARPYCESFASAMASSSEAKVATTRTGPKTSSHQMDGRRSGLTRSTVGSNQKPRRLLAGRLPPVSSSAPCATALLTMVSTLASCLAETSGPSVPVSSSWPTSRGATSGIACAASTSLCKKASATFSWTSSREVAEQICPLVQKAPNMTHSTALSNSTSSKTRMGDLPPSSREVLVIEAAADAITEAPVGPDPVNASLSTFECLESAAPALGPPTMTLRTPAGTPASCASLPSSTEVSGESSEGLSTTEQPAASAGAAFQEDIRSG